MSKFGWGFFVAGAAFIEGGIAPITPIFHSSGTLEFLVTLWFSICNMTDLLPVKIVLAPASWLVVWSNLHFSSAFWANLVLTCSSVLPCGLLLGQTCPSLLLQPVSWFIFVPGLLIDPEPWLCPLALGSWSALDCCQHPIPGNKLLIRTSHWRQWDLHIFITSTVRKFFPVFQSNVWCLKWLLLALD